MAEEKINKRTHDALKAIENAVFSLLEEFEFERITARGIYQRAEVNKMTFYKYYKNKYDALAKAFTSRVNDEYDTEISQWQDNNEYLKTEEAYYRGLMFVVHFFKRYHTQFFHLVSSGGDLPKDIVFSALFANYRPFFSALIGKEISKDAEYLVHVVFGTYRSIYECLMEQLAKNHDGPFPGQDVEKACRFISKAFCQLYLGLLEDNKARASAVTTKNTTSNS